MTGRWRHLTARGRAPSRPYPSLLVFQQAQWDGQAVCDAAYSSADNAWTDISALTTEILSLVEVTDAV